MLIKFLISFSCVFQIKPAPQLNDLQTFLTTLINDVRTSPDSFAKYIEERLLNKFEGKIFEDVLETIEGPSCMKDLSKELYSLQTLFPLQINPFLSQVAENHSRYMKEQGIITHYTQGSTPMDILKEKGTIVGSTG